MVRTMAGTLPWAVVLAAAGGGTWWLLSREVAGGRWLLAALLIGHGLVHLLFAVPASAAAEGGSATWPFEIGRSWAITGGHLDDAAVRLALAVLIGIAVGGFALAGLATLGIVVPAGWWPSLVTVAALASAIVLIVCFDPQLVLGLGMDAILLWVATFRIWTP
jgi:hypothetical protein